MALKATVLKIDGFSLFIDISPNCNRTTYNLRKSSLLVAD
jgi:hypothetical protein